MTHRLSRPPRRRALEAIALGAVLGSGVSQGPRAQMGQAAQPSAAAAPTATGSEDIPFAFALIGDLPYSDLDEPRLATMLTQIDAEQLALVLHVGDIKASREPCSNDLYQRRLKLLDASVHPLVLLPGDNEWTDCHRRSAGGFDPRERLEMLRKLFWSRPEPLGRNARSAVSSMAFERQAQMPENVRWKIGAVRFVAIHVVGSNNGLDEYPGSRDEFESRQKANQTWLFETLAMAEREQASALVIAAHGDPDFGLFPEKGHRLFLTWLQEIATRFRGQVLFLHGDSHRFKADQPLDDSKGRPLANFMRVESFGYPMSSNWVRIDYDPRRAQRFMVSPREVRQSGF
jgi:hypothetical protein